MENSILGLLNLLDFGDEDVLFHQRESGQARTPFELELQLYSFVSRGAADEMVAFYNEMFMSMPDLKVSAGRLSGDKLRQIKYLAVSMIAVICRVAIYSGVPEALAYSMSDNAILRIDKLDNPEDILILELSVIYEYARHVADSKASVNYSKAVRDSIEYITANLHSAITLGDLARDTRYSPEYLARLFKKEVGQTVSEYILTRRIEEAKKLIGEGKSSREIAYLLHFCSQSFFIKQFKKATGVTPREYRALHHSK